MGASTIERRFERTRAELVAYVSRLVLRPQVAEEIVQTAFLRSIEAGHGVPDEDEGFRAWLFRVATNLAFDELRRHSSWREHLLGDLRVEAESRPVFVQRSIDMIGTPETRSIAKEHLIACLACALKNLTEQQAAALLLKEMHGFSLAETAAILEARPAQVKNRLQEARATLNRRYADTCALIKKNGVCYQCVELDGFMRAGQANPLEGTSGSLDDRFDVAREYARKSWGPWHRILFELLEEFT